MSKTKIKHRDSARYQMMQQIMQSQHAMTLKMQRVQNNPLPEGEEGLGILRTLHECPIPPKSKELNTLLEQSLIKDQANQEANDKLLHLTTAALLGAQRECKRNLNSRKACSFNTDDKLKELHTQITALDEKAQSLNNQLKELVNEVVALLEQRWAYAVKTYGLNPEERSYTIDEEAGCINMVELSCATCGSKRTLDAAIQQTHHLIDAMEEDNDRE